MEFKGPDRDGDYLSLCGRYAVEQRFSVLDGGTIYRAWRLGDEVAYTKSIGHFTKPQYAFEACETDARPPLD
ncbi:MAG: hypothetical protein AB7F22_25535 [Reyranella sp.]|uniref:hypothetical protein n=1 Tax=Reyranella sp. TaxID=1929291 RepID=UPI003D099E19